MPVATKYEEDATTGRIARLADLLGLLTPAPLDWLKGSRRRAGGKGGTTMELEPCESYARLTTAWRKALRWTEGLDHALAVMLAAVASTKAVGDQLWVKIIGPAACGKSTLCEAISVCKEYVVAKSTIRGFHSGFREEGGGSNEDNSLVSLLYDKTLVTKDGDTLLQSPNLAQILSEARDLYDSTARTHYRNKMSKDYEGIRMTWILCGTSSLRQIDASELGERFLDAVIMEGIDDELEDEVLWRVANRADRNLSLEADGEAATRYEPELAEAMALTGGYVKWLRENATAVMPTIDNPEEAIRLCTRLGKFVAHMRARPSTRQEETAEREFASRLVSQLVRLGKCLALVTNRRSVDDTVMARVKRVALDTARGQTLTIAAHLRQAGRKGLRVDTLALYLAKDTPKVQAMLRFMLQIKMVEHFQEEQQRGIRGTRIRWRLTPRMTRLYDQVLQPGI